MVSYNELEIELYRWIAPDYRIRLKFIGAEGATGTLLDEGPAEITLPFEDLRATLLGRDYDTYGRQLRDAIFSEPRIYAKFTEWLANKPLRLRLYLDPTDTKLHGLHWEMLCGPEDEMLSSRSEICFSRYLPSTRAVSLRPEQADLRALIVVVNPSEDDRKKHKLSEIDTDFGRRAATLQPIPCDSLTNDEHPVTMNRIMAQLKKGEEDHEGYDILYLVCHGAMRQDRPILLLDLEGEEELENRGHFRSGKVFAQRMRDELKAMPRLALLASCASAGKGDGSALSALGPQLARAGVPAVIAMQGFVNIVTIEEFAPIFFKTLIDSGHVDEAMREARSHVRDNKGYNDWWMPVLFMRRADGRISYRPGFGMQVDGEKDLWKKTVNHIKITKRYFDEEPRSFCTPILGPGLTDHLFGQGQTLARNWAREDGFPLQPVERDHLPSVLQFSKVKYDEDMLRERYRRRLLDEIETRYKPILGDTKAEVYEIDKVIEKLWEKLLKDEPDEPHNILAKLPFTCYITTNPTDVLEVALGKQGRDPVPVVYRWWDERMISEDVAGNMHWPSYKRPIVFHLFGHVREQDSLVLTEDDYFKYMINSIRHGLHPLSKNSQAPNPLPTAVVTALNDAALVFLGFHLYDWEFRIVFRSLLFKPTGGGRLDKYKHAAAQISPQDSIFLNTAGAASYLQKYFVGEDDRDRLRLEIYWGEAKDFLTSLRDEWAKENGAEDGA